MPSPLHRLVLAVAFLFLSLPHLLTAAEPVSRTAPPLFAEKIAPLLTPLSDVLARRDSFPDTREHGVILLDETIHFRDDDGHNYVVYQDVYLARTDAAASSMGNRLYTYDREHDSIFLIEAATLQPNGDRQPLDDRAAFIQTPQREAEAGLYTSDQELNLIFPNIRAGSVTHMIVVIRENSEVFPGEFASRYTFGSGWPTVRGRVALDFPTDYMARVRTIESGGSVPEPVVTKSPGRERREWTRDTINKIEWEESAPPQRFRAPSLWFSSIDSWDRVAGWFHQLVQDRDELGADLEAKLAEWTQGLTERRAIADKLHTMVASEVRYTGLEFGLAGYQPYPCAQVWANRYGDCKDKANLLRALLRRKGIPAHLVLLETSGAGRVERRSPSWKQFNHAILAVEDGSGGYWFFDPTVRHLAPGRLPLGDSGREVLIVREGRAEWRSTPDLLDSHLRYEATLTLSPTGELSGWFAIRAEGSDAAHYADFFNDFSPSRRLRDLQDRIDDFFPGADVIDVDYQPATGAVDRFGIRAYFLRKAGDTLDTIAFPYPGNWLPSLDTDGERKFPYSARRRTETLAVTLTLPPGWNALELPAPFRADSPAASFSAKWAAEASTLRMELKWHPAAAEIPAADYAVFQRSVRTLQAWLKQPARITRSANVANTPTTATVENFPLLPTGDGQMRLLNERFPSNEGGPTRRAALEQVIQWFPDDATTVATARIYLALLDAGDNDAEVARLIRELLARYGNTINAETRTWGRYLQYRAEWWAAKSPEAIAGLQQLASDPSVSQFRRGWSAHYAALFLGEKDPAAALAYLAPWDVIATEARESTLKAEAGFLARAAAPATTTAWARRLLDQTASNPDELLSITLQQAFDDRAKLGDAALAHFATVLTPLFDAEPKLKKSREILARIHALGQAQRVRTDLTAALEQWTRRTKLPWVTRGRSKEFTTPEALEKQLDAMNDARNGPATIDAALQLLRFHAVPSATYDKYLYWMAWWLEHDAVAPDLLALAAQGSRDLPLDNGEFIGDVWLLFASAEKNAGHLDRARAEYRRILDLPTSPSYLRLEAAGELALLEVGAEQFAAARTAFALVDELHRNHTKGGDYLFAGVLFSVEHDEFDLAATRTTALAKISDERRGKLDYADAINALLTWAAEPAPLLAYWKKQAALRTGWENLLKKHGPIPRRAALPQIEDISALEKQLGQQAGAKNKGAFLRELDVLIRTGRIIPVYSINAVIQINQVTGNTRELFPDLFGISLDLLTEFPATVASSSTSARLLHAATLFDVGRPAESLAAARELYRTPGMISPIRSAAVRLWLLAAKGNAVEETAAIEAAAAWLASDETVEERSEVVAELTDAFSRRNDIAANVGLLAREINHPAIVANTTLRPKLIERLETLRRDSATGADFTAAINAWLKSRDLGFLDQMAPHSLDGPRYAQRNPQGFYDASVLPFHESVKANLLLARDPRAAMEARLQALQTVLNATAGFLTAPKDFAKHYTSLASLPALTDVARLDYLGYGASFLLRHGHATEAERMMETIADAGQRERFRSYFAATRAVAAALENYSATAAREALRTALAQPLTGVDAETIKNLLRRMVFAGDAAAATAELDAVTTLTARAGSGLSSAGLRLDFGRTVDQASAQLPYIQRVRALFAEHVPAKRNDVKTVQELAWLESLSSVDQLTRGRLVAAVFRDSLFTVAGPAEVLGALDHCTRFNASQQKLLLAVDREIATAPELDEPTRTQWMASNFMHVDMDQPDIRAAITAFTNELINRRGQTANSPSRRFARLRLAMIALRTSVESRPEALFGLDATAEIDAKLLRNLQFRFHCSRQQWAEAGALMAVLDPDELAGSTLIQHVDQVVVALNRPSERKLLRAAAVEKIREALPSLWFETEVLTLLQLSEAARSLGQPDLVPAALAERVIERQSDDCDRALGALARAILNGDWKAQLKAANALLKFVPDFYEANFYRSEATYQLGDKAGAKADLEVFLQHALESDLRARAQAML